MSNQNGPHYKPWCQPVHSREKRQPEISIYSGWTDVSPHTNFHLFKKNPLALLSSNLEYSPTKISHKDVFSAQKLLIEKNVCGREGLWEERLFTLFCFFTIWPNNGKLLDIHDKSKLPEFNSLRLKSNRNTRKNAKIPNEKTTRPEYIVTEKIFELLHSKTFISWSELKLISSKRKRLIQFVLCFYSIYSSTYFRSCLRMDVSMNTQTDEWHFC